MTKVRIGLCQTLCIDGDREGNFARIENALVRSRELACDIACFPECCLLGWVNPAAHRLAHPIPGEDTERLADLAQQYGMTISAGLAEKNGERLYDSAVLIDRDGTLLLKHRKINLLTELMTPPYTPGEEIRAVDTRYGRIGILICADTFLDENLKRMREQNPDLLFVPFGWAAEVGAWPEHGKSLEKTVAKTAKTIGAPVVGVDLVGSITNGPWTGQTYGGMSLACDTSGEVLVKARDRDVDLVTVEIPLRSS